MSVYLRSTCIISGRIAPFMLWGCLLLCTWALLTSCSGPKKLRPGDPAPEMRLVGLDGKTYDLKDYRGKLVLVNFWIDNCDVCKREFPLMQAYYEKLKAEGFELLSVYSGPNANACQEFSDAYGVTFPLLADSDQRVFKGFQVTTFSTNFLINPEGVVIKKIVGFADESQIEAVLHNLKMNAPISAK